MIAPFYCIVHCERSVVSYKPASRRTQYICPNVGSHGCRHEYDVKPQRRLVLTSDDSVNGLQKPSYKMSSLAVSDKDDSRKLTFLPKCFVQLLNHCCGNAIARAGSVGIGFHVLPNSESKIIEKHFTDDFLSNGTCE